ncbi:MAG: glycosyltransferase family 4 protein [Cyanobacteria bacterium Co-bin13]|nr:glycosyltransferase family 4 protein [Cyanobacteria bacterium Co-bin13]
MRVTFVTGAYRPDRCGVADYTAHLRSHLSKKGIASTVLTTHAAAQAANDPSVQGAVERWTLASLLPLTRKILTIETDILHIQHAAGSFEFQRPIFLLPALLRRLGYRQPIVTTAHEYGWWEWQPRWLPGPALEFLKQWGQQRGWWDREDGFLLTGSEAIITTNDNIARIMGERLPERRDRIYPIPIAANIEVAPVDTQTAREHLRQTYHWPQTAPVVAFFGFLHPVKGLETLLPAFQQVIQVHDQARLLLIGGVETLALQGQDAQNYWDKLQQQIADLGLKDHVACTGYSPAEEASRYLSGADIGVLPFNPGVTLKSGSLLALLAHRLPTLITQSEETDPILTTGEVVERVPPRHPDSLAAALTRLLQDADARTCLSQSGYAFVQRFGWDAIAQQHGEIYRSLE